MAEKLKWPDKDPNEVLDYDLDWSDRLPASDTISGSTFTVAEGDVTVNSSSFTTSTTKVWLSGGTDGTDCEILNRITTVGGRTIDLTVKLRVRSH